MLCPTQGREANHSAGHASKAPACPSYSQDKHCQKQTNRGGVISHKAWKLSEPPLRQAAIIVCRQRGCNLQIKARGCTPHMYTEEVQTLRLLPQPQKGPRHTPLLYPPPEVKHTPHNVYLQRFGRLKNTPLREKPDLFQSWRLKL